MIPIFVYITCSSAAEAEAIGHSAVTEQLAACANILPSMISVYRWQDKVERAQEAVLILKTRQNLFERLAAQVRALHSSDTPCIVALPLVEGDKDFLVWIEANTQS